MPEARDRDREDEGEPAIQAEPTTAETHLNRVLERIASILTSLVAGLLILFVVVALIGVVVAAGRPLFEHHDFTEAAIQGVDAAFLAIILLELVHTTLSRGPITRQLQEFLVIGITAGVRSGLEVAAGAREHNPRDVALNLALNAASVLILVGALWLVRQRLRADRGAEKGSSE